MGFERSGLAGGGEGLRTKAEERFFIPRKARDGAEVSLRRPTTAPREDRGKREQGWKKRRSDCFGGDDRVGTGRMSVLLEKARRVGMTASEPALRGSG
jgi:hypothetical protein